MSHDSIEKFSYGRLFCLSMASVLSLTDITNMSITSSKYSISETTSHHISVSPTARYSGDRTDLSRSFGIAFPLVVHRDYERRVLTVIEEPGSPIIRESTFYYTTDDPAHRFNLEGKYGVGRDVVLLYRADGWIVAIPDEWFGELGIALRIKRALGYICLSAYTCRDDD
jgi:hypothetical protein